MPTQQLRRWIQDAFEEAMTQQGIQLAGNFQPGERVKIVCHFPS